MAVYPNINQRTIGRLNGHAHVDPNQKGRLAWTEAHSHPSELYEAQSQIIRFWAADPPPCSRADSQRGLGARPEGRTTHKSSETLRLVGDYFR